MTLPQTLTVKRSSVPLHSVADRLERAGLLDAPSSPTCV